MSIKNIRLTRNPYLLFLPFLLLYIVFILILHSNNMWGDEMKHYIEAQNLLHGFYSPPAPYVEIRNGPGYPILIAPLVALHVPIIWMKLLNAVFLYLSIVFLFKAMMEFVSFRKALIIGLFWGCYYNSLDFVALLFSESFAVFLVSLLSFFLIKAFRAQDSKPSRKYIYSSGITFGFLVLTKIIFGYVLMFMIIGCALLWLLNRHAANYKRGILILMIAFISVTPYLCYTYYLTGRLFYWGTSAGNNLYWMASLSENEYGNWFPDPGPEGTSSLSNVFKKGPEQNGGTLNLQNRTNYIPGTEDSIKAYHQKNFEEINKYTGTERDDAYKKVVMRNIKANPRKIIENCISNIGRILFNYPYSYTAQKPGTLIRFPLNGTIAV